MSSLISRFFKAENGNIAVAAALTAPLLVAGLAVSVDYSALLKQRRSGQATVDLAAIAAAADPSNARVLLQRYYADNGLNYAVTDGGTTYTPVVQKANLDASDVMNYAVTQGVKQLSDWRTVDPNTGSTITPDCIASVEVGHYAADETVPVSARFQSGTSLKDAVRVKQTCRGHLYFASALMPEPDINVAATAASKNVASYWIGTRLGSLDGGLANVLLGALLGSSVSLKVVDYNSMASANVDILSTVKTLATNINMSALTYNDVLNANITLGQFFKAIRTGGNVNASTQVAMRALEVSVGQSNRTFKLSQILNLALIGKQPVGTGYGGASSADAFSLVRAAASVSNGQHQVEINVDYNVPGVGNANFRVMIGEPPVGSQSVAINEPGSLVRTAQIRSMVTFRLGSVPGMLGATLEVPIYFEVANGEAQLKGIRCGAGGVTGVDVLTYPGVAELMVGNVDPDAFINFGNKPRVTPASLLKVPGVSVTGSSQVDVKSMSGMPMSFTRSDIDATKVRNVSVKTLYTSYMTSLINNLNLTVNVSGFSLGTDQFAYRQAVVSALSAVTIPADFALATYMYVYGYKVGEAEVSITGAACGSPSLVL